jgi:hypothetical protein
LEGGIGGKIGSEGRGGGVGGVGGGFIKAEVTEWVSVVSKGASSSELASRAESIKNVSIGESERGGGRGMRAGTARRGTVRGFAGRVEAGDNGLVGVVHGGCGHGLKEAEAGGVVFIVIGEALSLAGGDGINWGKRWSGIGGRRVRGGK